MCFNIKRDGSEKLDKLDAFARRVHNLVGWYSELYIDSRGLPAISSIIEKLPTVSINHLGLLKEGLLHLLKLVDKGVRVKATGFGRVELDIAQPMKAIYHANPDAHMFGTDLPSTSAKRTSAVSDIELIQQFFDEESTDKILYRNAYGWYMKR